MIFSKHLPHVIIDIQTCCFHMQDSLDKPLFYMPVHLQPRVNELENLLFIDRDMILDFHDIIFFLGVRLFMFYTSKCLFDD